MSEKLKLNLQHYVIINKHSGYQYQEYEYELLDVYIYHYTFITYHFNTYTDMVKVLGSDSKYSKLYYILMNDIIFGSITLFMYRMYFKLDFRII